MFCDGMRSLTVIASMRTRTWSELQNGMAFERHRNAILA